MAIGCGAKCAKIILIIYNIIFLLTGLLLIALGIWLIVDGSIKNVIELTFNGTDSKLFRNAAILLITMGAIVVIISVLGFVGAIIENTIVLGVYIGFLVVIFLGEIAGGVLAIVFKDKIINSITTILTKSLTEQLTPGNNTYYSPYSHNATTTVCKTSDVGYLWDFAQITFECCGIDGVADYRNVLQNTPNYNFQSMCPKLNNAFYPASCCPFKDTATKFGDFHTDPDNQYRAQDLVNCASQYTVGCQQEVATWLEKYAPVLIGIGIGFAMIELFGIIFAVCVCRNVGDD